MLSSKAATAIETRLVEYRQFFDPLFAQYFAGLRESFDYPRTSALVPSALDLLEDLSLRGGKRQRVAFLYEAAKLVSNDEWPGLVECALSIELLQTHLLVHDDLIDDAPLRRGRPTTYYAYRDRYPGDAKTALGMTVLTGDIAVYLALDVLQASGIPVEQRAALVNSQVKAGLATFAGQVFDLERDLLGEVDEPLLFALADYKAARSSSVAPMEMGLIIAGGFDQEAAERINRYSLLFGIASQFHDDYLGMFGDAAVMGKSNVSDMREGRRTYLIQRTLDVCSPAQGELILGLLGNEEAADEEFDAIRKIVSDTGIEQELLAKEREYAEKAAEEARSWHDRWSRDAVEFFENLPLWSIERPL